MPIYTWIKSLWVGDQTQVWWQTPSPTKPSCQPWMLVFCACVCSACGGQKRALGVLEAGVTGVWELNSGPLETQRALNQWAISLVLKLRVFMLNVLGRYLREMTLSDFYLANKHKWLCGCKKTDKETTTLSQRWWHSMGLEFLRGITSDQSCGWEDVHYDRILVLTFCLS